MKAIEVANYLVREYGATTALTNLKLNKLVYFMQAVTLRRTGEPLFDDAIEAWKYGPVERDVYYAFKDCGSDPITVPAGACAEGSLVEETARAVMESYGKLSAFDLMRRSHDSGGAWAKSL